MKEGICTGIGVVGSGIAALFGGFDGALATLIIFMGVDYLTGLIVAGVFHNSGKSKSGALESGAGFRGLCRKGMTLLIVLVACRLDLAVGSSFIRDAAVIAFIANETISIIENAGLMGVHVPKVLVQAIEVLRQKSEGGEAGRNEAVGNEAGRSEAVGNEAGRSETGKSEAGDEKTGKDEAEKEGEQ